MRIKELVSVARLASALGIALLFVVTIILWRQNAATPVALPSDDDIREMTATVISRGPLDGMTEEFVVPPKYIPRIMEAFKGAHTARINATELPILAVLKLRQTSGETVQLTVSQVGQCPLGFTVDGMECVRGGEYLPYDIQTQGHGGMYLMECDYLAFALRVIYRELRTGKSSDQLESIFEELERSRGTRPPRRYSDNDAAVNPPARH